MSRIEEERSLILQRDSEANDVENESETKNPTTLNKAAAPALHGPRNPSGRISDRLDEYQSRKRVVVVDDDDAEAAQDNVKYSSKWDIPSPPHPSSTTLDAVLEAPKKISKWDIIDSATPSSATPPTKSLTNISPSSNEPWTPEALDHLLPKVGYTILAAPEGYKRNPPPPPLPSHTETTTQPGFTINIEDDSSMAARKASLLRTHTLIVSSNLPPLRPEDLPYFGLLLLESPKNTTTSPEKQEDISLLKRKKILKFLLAIKNGQGAQRRTAIKGIVDRSSSLGGPAPIFKELLPILQSNHLREEERYILVKTLDLLLTKFASSSSSSSLSNSNSKYEEEVKVVVQDWAKAIIAIGEPMLIDSDSWARFQGRQLIANLAKYLTLPPLTHILRPSLDDKDDWVRNVTARVLAVVSCSLGIPRVHPFLRAIASSTKNPLARQTCLLALQHIGTYMGSMVLPHLALLLPLIEISLEDCDRDSHSSGRHSSQSGQSSNNSVTQRTRTLCASTVASLAAATHPHGISFFEPTILPLIYRNTRRSRSRALNANLRAMGNMISLMEGEQRSYWVREVVPLMMDEWRTTMDDEMTRTYLTVLGQCCQSSSSFDLDDTVQQDCKWWIEEVVPDYFRSFWSRKTVLGPRGLVTSLLESTEKISKKVGYHIVIERLSPLLRDASEPLRRYACQAIGMIVAAKTSLSLLRSSGGSSRLEESLVDGMLFTFQEQQDEDPRAEVSILGSISSLFSALGRRMSPYWTSIGSMILWRLSNKDPRCRRLSCDLLSKIIPSLNVCDEVDLLSKIGLVLGESLGEEYPECLAAILGSLKALLWEFIDTPERMQPKIQEILLKMSPILRNRNEDVQQHSIDIVGMIAEKAGDVGGPKEWMRISFELLDLLKAPRRSVRRAAILSFGHIAKTVGPIEVLQTLLNNLKVQERQNRVCTTIAIGIVAESCAPFTVLPSLITEYRVPEQNVQNGVLKALSYMFEYIGPMSKDYVFSVTGLLEDALIDRDQVHRQAATAALKQLCLGVLGSTSASQGTSDGAFVHLLNYVLPNIFDGNPHLISAVVECMDAMRLCLGPAVIFAYLIQGLWHPARRVREIYWRLYNNLYIGSQHSLVAYYPLVRDEDYGVEGSFDGIKRTSMLLNLVDESKEKISGAAIDLCAPPHINRNELFDIYF